MYIYIYIYIHIYIYIYTQFLIGIFQNLTNYKIIDRNNVKISYSSLPNFASTINSYNKKIIKTI